MNSPLPPVALASKSPRRRELFERSGIEHVVVDARIDDSDLVPGSTNARAWVMAMAYLKAAAALEIADRELDGSGWVVLGADTVCVLDGRIIGQPSDRDDARAIIKAFCGRVHEVLTGMALIDLASGRREIFLESARVSVGSLTDIQVDNYLDTGLWQGKAGAYNLSERLEAGWPIAYSGDPDGIMGLPMRVLQARLGNFLRN